MKINKEKNFWLGALLILLIDQMSKIWAVSKLELNDEIILNHYFSFQRIYNEATVLLNFELPFGVSVTQFRVVWVIVAMLITLAIGWTIRQPVLKKDGWIEEFAKTGLFLILGANWGNCFDRIFRKEGVIDFLSINISDNVQPIVNYADIMIYVGEFSILIAWILILIQSVGKKNILNTMET